MQGEWTGQLKAVRLNHLYKGGKLADMPSFNKSTDIDPNGVMAPNKRTVTQALTRSGPGSSQSSGSAPAS